MNLANARPPPATGRSRCTTDVERIVTARHPDGRHSTRLAAWIFSHTFGVKGKEPTLYRLKSSSGFGGFDDSQLMLSTGNLQDHSRVSGSLLSDVLASGAAATVYPQRWSIEHAQAVPEFWDCYATVGLCAVDVAHAWRIDGRFDECTDMRHCHWCGHAEHLPRRFVVYTIRNRQTGRVYFGSSGDVAARWSAHRRDFRLGNHPNEDLRADAEHYGIDVFKFSIVARFNNAQAMLRREQLFIAMYYNSGCYNYAASVYSHGALGIVRVHVHGDGVPFVQEFLSLHAAVRAFGLTKRVVREAIIAGHGRVGAIQFPINVPMTRVIDGEFPHPFQETGHQYKITPRAVPANRRSAAQVKAAWPAEVAQALNLQARSVAAWRDGQSRRRDSKAVLLRLVELFGVEWAKAAAPFVGAERDLPDFLAKYNLIDHAIVEWMAMTQARWTELVAGTKALTRVERVLLGLAAHYGYLEGRPIGDTGRRYRATLQIGPGERL